MTRPSRHTSAGRAYLDLRALARRDGRPTDEVLVLFVLERFLYRLSLSAHRERLVLKGGMLLAVFEERRPTRDVDLLARATRNNVETVVALIRDVLAVEADDGVVFDTAGLTARVIREGEIYAGVRIVVPARVDRARHPLRVDVNVGDPVTPAPVEVDFPALLAEPFRVVAYPIETVLAEKIVTMIDRGDATTRERDFADVVLLTRRPEIDAKRLSEAIAATASHRRSELRALQDVLVTLGIVRQGQWERFVRRHDLGADLPDNYGEAIAMVAEFADPLLSGAVTSGHWDPLRRTWPT
jgi:predicted nucleotidyltransferase component of viral defense system